MQQHYMVGRKVFAARCQPVFVCIQLFSRNRHGPQTHAAFDAEHITFDVFVTAV
jgi:hypothetical protein